jgi:hypothetical protein
MKAARTETIVAILNIAGNDVTNETVTQENRRI